VEEVFAGSDPGDVAPGRKIDAPSIISMSGADRYGSFEAVHSPGLEVDTRHYPQDESHRDHGYQGVL